MTSGALCECGCGEITSIVRDTDSRRGLLAGQPRRFIHGHRGRLPQRRGPQRRETAALFWQYVQPEPNSGCWIWSGARNNMGYGILGVDRTHRIAYTLLRGPIPDGLVLDHLCRIRCCVNPWHVEAVQQSVNVQRGARAHYGDRCRHGHAPEDMRYRPGGSRYCAVCNRLRARRAA